MSDKTVKLSNGKEYSFSIENYGEILDVLIEEILLPFYEKTNDWMKTINKGVEEVKSIANETNVPRLEIVGRLFVKLETHLKTTVEQLDGVNEVEILFLSLDDYIQRIKEITEASARDEDSQAVTRRKTFDLLRELNFFEIGELLIALGKLAFDSDK